MHDEASLWLYLTSLFSDQYTQLRRPLVDLKKASTEIRPGDPYQMRPIVTAGKNSGHSGSKSNDTTTCVVADRWGNVVAATPSGWGSVADEGGPTGITHGTRLVSLNTWKGHPNCIQPGKRPRITLTPTLVSKNGQPALAISVAGGDHQDQTTLQVLLNVIEFGMDPTSAVTAPRFSTAHHIGSFGQPPPQLGTLSIYTSVPASTIAELQKRGHQVRRVRGPIGQPILLTIETKDGKKHVAGDPRAQRHVAAY